MVEPRLDDSSLESFASEGLFITEALIPFSVDSDIVASESFSGIEEVPKTET